LRQIKEGKMKKNKNNSATEDWEDEENSAELNDEENAHDEEASSIKDLRTEVEKLKADNEKLHEDFLRAYADAENTKKRCAQELEKNSKYAISSFAKELLVVADNLHRALEAADDGDAEQMKQFKEGVKLTESELMKVFKKFGIVKIDAIGKVFDPGLHRVVQEVEDKEKPSGTIVAELQTGYMINDRLLREAMVIVSK